jgi:hypothetical protein
MRPAGNRDAYLRVRAAVVVGAGVVGAGANVAGADVAPAPDWAIAGELIVVESSIVIAGGTTTANLPAVARNARRSVPSFDRVSCGSILVFSIEQTDCMQMITAATSTGSKGNCREAPWFRHICEHFRVSWRQLCRCGFS